MRINVRKYTLIRSRVPLTLLAVILLQITTTGVPVRAEQSSPNVILFLVDDLGWTDVGCYGSSFYDTPNIDRLGREGRRFTSAYAACAVCSPTRAAVLTGRYPSRIGITDWIHFAAADRIRTEASEVHRTKWQGGAGREVLCPPNPYWMNLPEVTIAEMLGEQGYHTAHMGKWHLGGPKWHPETQGFDINVAGYGRGQPPSYFDPFDRHRANRKPWGPIPTIKPRRKGEHLTDRLADEAVGFINDCKEQPFFLYMSFYAVHTPIEPRQDLLQKYQQREPSGPQKNAAYAALVEGMDQAVGKILNRLDQLNLTDNTIVIFTSDNGGYLAQTSNVPLRSGKGFPYEGGLRVPAIVRWPGHTTPGSESNQPISSVDWFPTIAEICDVSPSDGRARDGHSLVSILTSSSRLDRQSLLWHFPHYRVGKVVPYSVIRQGNWKLIRRYAGATRFELFDLQNDLSETKDLSVARPELVRKLDEELSEMLQDTGAKLPQPNPNYRTN